MFLEPPSSGSPHPEFPKTGLPGTHRIIQTCEWAHPARAECLLASQSHLDVADLQRNGASLGTDDVVVGSAPHLSLQGLKLTVDVWKLTLS